MKVRYFLIIYFSLIAFNCNAFEPYSGISCHNSTINGNIEFFFKHDENFIYAKAYKRVEGKFRQIGNVVGQKISSFILFEDKTVDKDLNFAWHLDMVTKNLKPFILSETRNRKFVIPNTFDCISKNFWF
ncbi:hypothetical protein N8310_06045 [Pseudomonadota bacterium]|nr:hypothetical protein [Pseudomonadota bacterium]